jgi:hypothetical protein
VKIYVAGPMQGLPKLNYPLFMDVAAKLRAEGHEVKNPAEHPITDEESAAGEVTLERHCALMRRDIEWVLEVEAICLLPGWQRSSGASIELSVGRAIGLRVYEWEDRGQTIGEFWPESAALPDLYTVARTMEARVR